MSQDLKPFKDSYEELVKQTDLKILNSEIGDDFIGVFDTTFDGTPLINVFENLKKSNKCFRRNSRTVKKAATLLDDDVLWSSITNEKEDSFNMSVSMNLVTKYNEIVALCYDEYVKKYDILNHLQGCQYTVNIQKNEPGQGYHIWHHEIEAKQAASRFLVSMVYLNTVIEGGETEFLYQHRRIQPQNGRVVLWPAQWSHTHRGNTPLKGNKYIATSWIHYAN